MARITLRQILALLTIGLVTQTIVSSPISISIESVSDLVIQSALNSLNQESPTKHTYKSGSLISAQKLSTPPYVIYKLTLNLEPDCDEAAFCPREECAIDIKQHEQGVIEAEEKSKQCVLLNHSSDQNSIQDVQEQKFIQVMDKKIIGLNDKIDDEVQDVTDHNDKPFTAVRASTHYCPGCPYELNPTLRGLESFGELAADSIDKLGSSDFKHKMISIVRVTRAIPPGSNVIRYELLMEIGETNCPSTTQIQRSECNIQSNVPIKLCHVVFEERSHLGHNRQLTYNNCTTSSDKINELNGITKSALVGESLVTPNIDENDSLEEVNSEAYDQVALEGQFSTIQSHIDESPQVSISNSNLGSEITENPLTKITLSREDFDEHPSKFEDKFKDFDKFLEDFDIPTVYTKFHVEQTGPEVVEDIIRPEKVESREENLDLVKSRVRRNDPLLGGKTPISLNDPEVGSFNKWVNKGLKQLSSNSDDLNTLLDFKILSATKQVVSGLIYEIKVQMGNKECTVKVWTRPWLRSEDPDQITTTCDEPKRKKRSLRGANYLTKMMYIAKQIELERQFNEFQTRYNKIYSSEEERQARLRIFQENMKLVKKLQENEQGTAEYGATMFADMTMDEYRKYLGYNSSLRSENDIPLAQAEIPDIELPVEYDWRNYSVVTPVKNQGSCGSCWAFSVTGNVEGQYAIKHGKLLSLSEQELVDCDKLDEGCNGGLQENAYRAIEQIGGLELEDDYPYDGEDETCNFKKRMAKVQIASAVNITSNETQMAQWLVKNGPMAIAINANAMQFYMGGISHPFKFLCSKSNLDHGVLIVGYGVHNYPLFKKTLPYWIVKNSWGPSWGEQGYYRVYRGDGTCGLNMDVSSAIVA